MSLDTVDDAELLSADFWKSQNGFPGLGRKLRIFACPPNQGGVPCPL